MKMEDRKTIEDEREKKKEVCRRKTTMDVKTARIIKRHKERNEK